MTTNRRSKQSLFSWDWMRPRALSFACLAIGVRVLEVYWQRDIEREAPEIKLGNAAGAWRTAFPKRPELMNASNATDQVVCIYICISSLAKSSTRRYSEDMWNWTQKVTTWGLAGQTYPEFEILADYPDEIAGSSLSYNRMLVQQMGCTTADIDSLLSTDPRNCSWVVTTRIEPGSYVKPEFVSDMLTLLSLAFRRVVNVGAVILSSKFVRQVTVDGAMAERCELIRAKYGQGGGPVGQTLAVKYETWRKFGGLTVAEVPYARLWDAVTEKYSSGQAVMPVELHSVHAFEIVTRLSGPSFPWIEGLPKCDKKSLEDAIGIALFTKYKRLPIPNTPFTDVCESYGNLQEAEETRDLFNASDPSCRSAKGFFWQTEKFQNESAPNPAKFRQVQQKVIGEERKEFCTFFQIRGPHQQSHAVFEAEYWSWTAGLTLDALSRQSISDFAVIGNVTQLRHASTARKLRLFNAPLTTEGIAQNLPSFETTKTCEWVVSVSLSGGEYVAPSYLSDLYEMLRSVSTKHRQVDAIILSFREVKQVVVDRPSAANKRASTSKKTGSAVLCQTHSFTYDDAGSVSARALAVKRFYWRQSKGATSAECASTPVGCVQRTGVPKRKIAHGHLKGTGVELISRLHTKFPWARPLPECDVSRTDHVVGAPVLSAAQRAAASMPTMTTYLQACSSNPDMLEQGRDASAIKGKDCQGAADTIDRRQRAEKASVQSKNEG